MTKLKNCPLCGSSVELIEGQDPSCLAIVCGCGLRKTRTSGWDDASLSSTPPRYDTCKKKLIAQWNSRSQLEEAYEALRAYNAASICPGILLESGVTSGCAYFRPLTHVLMDCPTCIVVSEAENN